MKPFIEPVQGGSSAESSPAMRPPDRTMTGSPSTSAEMSQKSQSTSPRNPPRAPSVPASDADRLREGLPLESGDALPPPRRPLH